MNSTIEVIAANAGMVEYPTGLGISENTIWGDRNITKFAELLVLHCCDRMLELERDYLVTVAVRNLKREFGLV